MTPSHHLGSDLLLAYAAGSLEDAVSLFVATHLALCPDCRSSVDQAEAVGGAMLEEQPPAEVGGDVLESLLGSLVDGDREVAPEPSPAGSPVIIPEPLRSLTGPFADIPWEKRAPGIRTFEIGLDHRNLPVRLFRLTSGISVPTHSHNGLERGMVLTGGFTDDVGHFVRGDVSVREPGFDHVAKVDEGEACVALFVNDALLVPRTLVGRIASRWVKL